ncbi:MAG: hypothetical protein U0R51_09970 [Solirubrobacterales bacterium]
MSDEPVLGLEGEACRSCHAPLATDQRYCMNCGERRGATRVDLDAMAADQDVAPGGAPVAPAIAPAASSQGPWTPMAIVGGIATLAVVLLVGVMLGRGDNNDPVQVAAAPVATTAAATTTTADPGTEKVASTGGGDAKKKDEKNSGGGGDKVVDATKAPGAETVTDDQLNALDEASGDDYAKQSKNLPDTIALPGEPPPKDNEAPGGGGPAQVIK